MYMSTAPRRPPPGPAGAHRPRPPGVGQRLAPGFTLVEVMVAVAILALGMLGTVGMQAFALQSNRDARLQAQAVALANELADMMRGNMEISAQNSAAANPYLLLTEWDGSADIPTRGYCLRVGQSCGDNITAVAQAEMTDWLARINSELPGVRVKVCFDSQPYSNSLPQWLCDNNNTNGTAVIKIGWNRASTDSTKTTPDKARTTRPADSRPQVIFPVNVARGT